MTREEMIEIAQKVYATTWGEGQPGELLRVTDLAQSFAQRLAKGESIPEQARERWSCYVIVWFRAPHHLNGEFGVQVDKTTGQASEVVAD